MQPYFAPYAGYFRLMCDVDAFVVLDAVQFPRGGWVHRNRLRRRDGASDWFTLPIQRPHLETQIGDLVFQSAAERAMARAFRRFPLFDAPSSQILDLLPLLRPDIAPCAFLVRLLVRLSERLGLKVPFVLQSDLGLPTDLKGVDRVYEICRRMNAGAYVNSPGGRLLYSAEGFARRGLALSILPDYRGASDSILQRLQDGAAADIAAEIRNNL